MTLFAKLADRWNAVPAATSFAAALLLVMGLAVIYQNEQSYQSNKTRETHIQAEILAASVAAALDFGDASAAQESVDALRLNPQVRIAAVYNNRGEAFAGFARDGISIPVALDDGKQSRANVAAVVPVGTEGTRVGTVRLEVAREPVSRRVARYALVALFVIMAALVVGVLGLAHNVLRRTNARLEATNRELTVQIEERAKAEDQLRQAQKMEAMGQLTGGVAHDFNNLLTPIIGSLDRLQRKGGVDERDARLIDGAMQSAERARILVQRLLAFARRQPLQTTAVDVGGLIEGLVDLLESTVGPRVQLSLDITEGLPAAAADENQIEMAILNLAVNARDAMTNGGKLSIGTRLAKIAAGSHPELKPGEYIRVSIADTGDGMDEATLARAVEPFFSTKGIGQGTGLGLSMVHGLAAQLGGALTIASTVGHGTDIDLYLPVSEQIPRSIEANKASLGARQSGTVLLVDDEILIRMSTADLLSDLGYNVVDVGSAEEALHVVAQGQQFDILVTDHLMPGLSGIGLAQELRKTRPELPVLVISGYADIEGVDPDIQRLVKPFRLAELEGKLHELGNRVAQDKRP